MLALDGVTFVLGRGEIHALVGQNGAGKSTMINVLSGMLAPDAGEIRLAGQPASIDSTRKAIELGIATVYQELSLLPNLTVAQNIALGHEPRRVGLLDVAAMRTAARKALARIGMEMAVDIPVGPLSLAERQLVEIAKALAHDPTVLVLDEPTAALGAPRGRAPVRHPAEIEWRGHVDRLCLASFPRDPRPLRSGDGAAQRPRGDDG